MCDRADDVKDAPPKKPVVPASQDASAKMCKKCGVKPGMLLMPIDPYCSDCFMSQVSKKFKTNVRRRIIVERGDRILVAFSGGPSSRMVLDMLQSCVDKSAPRRMLFTFDIVHVDETTLLSRDDTEAGKSAVESILAIGRLYDDSRVCSIPIESVLDSQDESAQEQDDGSLSLKLQAMFDSLSDLTDKDDLLRFLRMRALASYAVENGYQKIVLGESSDRVAISALASTSKGRGFAVSDDAQYISERFDVQFLRPLRDFLLHHIGHYVHARRLDTVFRPTFRTEVRDPNVGGINTLMESFITSLQSKFFQTVPNIVRTCAKLELAENLPIRSDDGTDISATRGNIPRHPLMVQAERESKSPLDDSSASSSSVVNPSGEKNAPEEKDNVSTERTVVRHCDICGSHVPRHSSIIQYAVADEVGALKSESAAAAESQSSSSGTSSESQPPLASDVYGKSTSAAYEVKSSSSDPSTQSSQNSSLPQAQSDSADLRAGDPVSSDVSSVHLSRPDAALPFVCPPCRAIVDASTDRGAMSHLRSVTRDSMRAQIEDCLLTDDS